MKRKILLLLSKVFLPLLLMLMVVVPASAKNPDQIMIPPDPPGFLRQLVDSIQNGDLDGIAGIKTQCIPAFRSGDSALDAPALYQISVYLPSSTVAAFNSLTNTWSFINLGSASGEIQLTRTFVGSDMDDDPCIPPGVFASEMEKLGFSKQRRDIWRAGSAYTSSPLLAFASQYWYVALLLFIVLMLLLFRRGGQGTGMGSGTPSMGSN